MIPPRILVIGPAARRMLGGQEVEAALLLRQWQNDSDAEVSFLPNNPAPPRWLHPIEHVPYLRTAMRLPVYALSIYHQISRFDLVHIFSASYSSFLLTSLPAWLISRWHRKRIVLNYRTARHWQEFATSRIAQFVITRADAIVVPSPYLAAKFEKLGVGAFIVPDIIDDRFQYRPRINLQPRIICARNLSPDYGIDVVLNAFSIVQGHYPDASLYLTGAGPRRRDLEAQVRTLGLSGVEFCGTVPNEQMREWYERADIFLNASVVDNAPLSILEAFACGLPIVTTAPGGIPLMVRHEETALVAPVGDARTLADHVLRLLREPAFAAKLARQAHERLEPRRWASVRVKWLEVYTAKGDANGH